MSQKCCKVSTFGCSLLIFKKFDFMSIFMFLFSDTRENDGNVSFTARISIWSQRKRLTFWTNCCVTIIKNVSPPAKPWLIHTLSRLFVNTPKEMVSSFDFVVLCLGRLLRVLS